MQVTFTRMSERTYGIAISREHGPDIPLAGAPGYDDWMPHDLAHYLVEEHFGIRLGIFGQAAAGGGSFVPEPADRNGRVARTASPDPYGAVAAAMINFLIGTFALALVFVVDLAIKGAPRALPSEPWLYIGGACGVAFITLAAAIVRIVGVFVLGLGTIAGQLVGSLVLDLTVPASNRDVTAAVFAGTALALVAVVVAATPGLRRR